MAKAKDLRIPFKEGKREPLYFEGLIAVPDRSDLHAFVFPGWETLFGNNNPVVIEYCSGNGSWIEEKARTHPHLNFLACEKRLDRAKKIWAKVKNMKDDGLTNLVVAYAEGLLFTKSYIPSASITTVYVNFPDPWPKRRQHKNRIINSVFIEEMARILTPGGTVILVTDDPDYSEWMIQHLQQSPHFAPCFTSPYYIPPPKDYGSSFFDELFRGQMKPIRYHEFKKR